MEGCCEVTSRLYFCNFFLSDCISRLVVGHASILVQPFCTQIFLKALEMEEALMGIFLCHSFPSFHDYIFLWVWPRCGHHEYVPVRCLGGDLLMEGPLNSLPLCTETTLHTGSQQKYEINPNSARNDFFVMDDFSSRTPHQICRHSLRTALQPKTSSFPFSFSGIQYASWSEDPPRLLPLLPHFPSQAFFPMNVLYV